MSRSSALTFTLATTGAWPCWPAAENVNRLNTASAAPAKSFLIDFMSVVFYRADLNFLDLNLLKRTTVQPICVFEMKRDAGGFGSRR